MARKENEKDERPHYYSQFWLDIAAGRKVIGGPKLDEDSEPLDEEPVTVRRPPHSRQDDIEPAYAGSDGHSEAAIVHPGPEMTEAPGEFIEPETEEDVLVNSSEMGNLDLQEASIEDADIPDMDLSFEEEEEEGEEFFDEEEEEEEEEEWAGGRGRKKSKPTRPTKQPKRPIKRDTRRGY